jgi:hypothetical protein
MATLFAGDESGNLGFDFSHGGTQYVADLIAGAVLGKYAKGDDRYFRLIQDRLVVAEFPKQQKPPS